jgi:hypothetical protein
VTPRNAPCPCGSGRKHKLCCGTTRDQERAIRERLELVRELVDLPGLFPELRPESGSFERWASGLDQPVALDEELLAEGLEAIGRRDRHRIVRAHAERFPDVWAGLVAGVGDRETAERALLGGAVVFGLRERRVDPDATAHLEECEACRGGPVEALARALGPHAVWSIHEALAAVAALDVDGSAAALRDEATALASRWHRRRLDALVRRTRTQLPLAGLPLASAALAAACDAFEREREVREALLAALLADAVVEFGDCVDRLAA